MLRLHTFGGLFLERDGLRMVGNVTQRKRLVLLAVLATEQRSGATREKVAALLWPEADGVHSRNALYQAVASIRRDLGSEILIGSAAGDLRLNDELVSSDFDDLSCALSRNDLEGAVAAYAGPFLDGVHIRGAPDLEHWMDETRRSCAARYQDALRELAHRATSRGEHAVAAQWLRRLAEADALSASVALRLMEALAASGEREAAIRHARVHLELVRAESEGEGEQDPRVSAMVSELLRGVDSSGAHRDSAADARSGVGLKVGSSSASGASSALAHPSTTTTIPPDSGAVTESTDLAPAAELDAIRKMSSGAVESMQLEAPKWIGPWRGRKRLVALASLAVAVALIALTALAIGRRGSAAAPDLAALDPHRVVVADFENHTGDSTYDLLGATLADWVTQGVMQTGVARVIDPASRFAVRRFSPEVTALTGRERVIAMARAAAAGTVVSGTIYRQGGELAIRARITDLVDDRVIASLDPIPAPLEDVLRHAELLRDRIAGALSAAFDARIASITLPSSRPPTLAAYQEYIVGLEAFQRSERLALPHFQRAAQLDTTFALPLIWAAFALGNQGRQADRDSVVALLAHRRPARGTLEELQLQEFQAGDADEELLLLERGARLSPGSTWSHNVGRALHDRNRMREAIGHFREVDPEHGWVRTWGPYWLYYSRALHAVGDYQEELLVARRFRALDPALMRTRGAEVRALQALGNVVEARRRLADLLLLPEGSDCVGMSPILDHLGTELQAHAHRVDADSVFKAWIDICRRDDARRAVAAPAETSAAGLITDRAWLGVALYRAGRLSEAERTLRWATSQRAIDSATTLLATAFLGRLAARQGDRQGAERAMRAFPTGFSYLWNGDVAYAAIAALLGDRERAVQRLAAASKNLPYHYLHRDSDFESLRSYAPFAALVAPK